MRMPHRRWLRIGVATALVSPVLGLVVLSVALAAFQ